MRLERQSKEEGANKFCYVRKKSNKKSYNSLCLESRLFLVLLGVEKS